MQFFSVNIINTSLQHKTLYCLLAAKSVSPEIEFDRFCYTGSQGEEMITALSSTLGHLFPKFLNSLLTYRCRTILIGHWKYDVWHHRFQKPPFRPFTRKRQAGVFKTSTLWAVFNARKYHLHVRGKLNGQKKSVPFQKYPVTCGQGLR